MLISHKTTCQFWKNFFKTIDKITKIPYNKGELIMKIVKINLDVTKDTNLPIVSINYDPEHLISEPLVWESITPEIVEVNAKTREICALQCGKGTICAKDENGFVRVYCLINVKNANENEFTKATATKNKFASIEPTSRMYSDWYGNNTTDSVTATGYSGDGFSYSKNGNYVTLECAGSVKSGIEDSYSSMFRSELVTMNNIFLSLTTPQIVAWGIWRLAGIIIDAVIPHNQEALLKSLLISAGIDLADDFVKTVLTMKDWHIAEMNAKSYFCNFT